MLQRRVPILALFILHIALPVMMSSGGDLRQQSQRQACECFNGGSCPNKVNYIACNCPWGFIGNKCQTQALQIKNIDRQAMINEGYSYFYFQPMEINYYQMSLKICLPQNQNKKLVNLVFLEVERSSGKLKLQPSIYQTSPLSFEGAKDRCQTFSTHYIPIRRKMNDQLQKIVFGVAIKNNSDSAANRWVSFIQKSLANAGQQLKANQIFTLGQTNQAGRTKQPQVQRQKITISCTYQLYIVENYWSTAIIVVSSVILFFCTMVFLYIIRGKYFYSISNEDTLRIYVINSEDLASSQPVKNDLNHFKLIMPSMSYELLLQKDNKELRKYQENMLRKAHEIQRGPDKDQPANKDQPQAVDAAFDSEAIMKYYGDIQTDQNVCTICLCDFSSTEQVRRTPCKHLFHSECIDDWCHNTLNCPVCRQNLQIPNNLRTKRQYRALIQR